MFSKRLRDLTVGDLFMLGYLAVPTRRLTPDFSIVDWRHGRRSARIERGET